MLCTPSIRYLQRDSYRSPSGYQGTPVDPKTKTGCVCLRLERALSCLQMESVFQPALRSHCPGFPFTQSPFAVDWVGLYLHNHGLPSLHFPTRKSATLCNGRRKIFYKDACRNWKRSKHFYVNSSNAELCQAESDSPLLPSFLR